MPCRRDYEFGRQLGRGSFGVVHKVVRKADKAPFVCKEINLRGLKSKAREEAHQEVALLRRVSSGSPHVVQYIESFLERDSLHIIMEFCEHGDLSQYLKARRGALLEEDTIWKYLIQVGLGLQWLHASRILHRDIKSLNVFLTATNEARLGDLGVARVLSEGTNFASTLIGTPYYLSPELCENLAYNDRSDVWAYGCVLFEMCTLRHPFEARNQAALLVKILSGRRDVPIPVQYSGGLCSIIDGCLQHEFEHRPAIAEMIALPVVGAAAERLGIMLEKAGETVEDAPRRVEARKRWQKVKKQASHLHDEAVRGLDAPSRLVWDSLYRMLRAKMHADLTEADRDDIERHIFEDLPPEHTAFIPKVCKILPLEQQCDQFQAMLEGTEMTGAS